MSVDINQSKHLRTKGLAFVAIFLFSWLFSSALSNTDFLGKIENRTWDLRQSIISNPAAADRNIKIIGIDQGSLDYFEAETVTWPWPRSIYIPVLKFLERSRAKGVAFDLLFTENSAAGVEDDLDFARSLSLSLPVVNACVLNNRPPTADSIKIGANLPTPNYLLFGNYKPRASFDNATWPYSELLQASAGIGAVNGDPDSDGVFRRYSPGATVLGTSILGLPLALYAAIPNATAKNITEFLDKNEQLIARFNGPTGTYPQVNIVEVIQSFAALEEGRVPKIPVDYFKDSYVFIGAWAPGLLDLRPSPLDKTYRGVEFNATILDNLIHQNFIRKTSTLTELGFSALVILLFAMAVCFLSRVRAQVLAFLTLLALLFTCALQLAEWGIWINLAAPTLGAVVASLSGLVFIYGLEGRQHRFIRQAFGYYVSPEVIKKIVANPQNLSIGGERKELTMFFSDLAGFTSISESLDPSKLVQLLNEFLSSMTGIIQQHSGTVDKYQGDAIIAFWNAPLSVTEHASLAVEAAIACQQKLGELRAEFNRRYGVALRMRIGIHTGMVSVGNFGSKERFNYTVIGDAANLASRLEGANKAFGTEILVSEATRAATNGKVSFRQIAKIKVIGKSELVEVFEPISPAINRGELQQYNLALELLINGKSNDALAIFKTLTHDHVAQAYVKRLESDQTGLEWELDSK